MESEIKSSLKFSLIAGMILGILLGAYNTFIFHLPMSLFHCPAALLSGVMIALLICFVWNLKLAFVGFLVGTFISFWNIEGVSTIFSRLEEFIPNATGYSLPSIFLGLGLLLFFDVPACFFIIFKLNKPASKEKQPS